MKRLLILMMLAVCTSASGFAQGAGTLAGRVVDAADSTGLPSANVIIEGTTLGAATDLDGNYRIIGVPVGVYDVTARYIGYEDEVEASVEINAGYTRTLNFKLEDDAIVFDSEPSCYDNRRPFLFLRHDV